MQVSFIRSFRLCFRWVEIIVNHTKMLVEFVHDANHEQLPKTAFEKCKRHLLDCTGAALAAVNEVAGRIIHDHIKETGAAGQARLIGSGLRTSIENAAFANGILAHSISFDDSGPSHPSVTVVPPLYALAESYGVSGKDFLTAQAIGYEVFQRLNLVTQKARAIRDSGWHPTGFFGAVTSCLISGRLLGLSLDQSLNAIGIAASMGAGLSQNIGNMTMSLHAGNAARNGITAALLAKRGFTGDTKIMQGRFGLMNALAGEGNFDLDQLTKDLGSSYCVIDPGINIKNYPLCWGHHKLIDAMLFLVHTHDIKPDDVASIECDLQPEKSTSRYLSPENEFQAKYSIGYGIAMCLLDREITFEQYLPQRIADSRTREVISKIKHIPQGPLSAPDKFKVTVRLHNGESFSKTIKHPKGEAKFNPLSDDELRKKFIICAGRALPDEKIRQALDLIGGMENLDDVTQIMDAVTLG